MKWLKIRNNKKWLQWLQQLEALLKSGTQVTQVTPQIAMAAQIVTLEAKALAETGIAAVPSCESSEIC